MTFDPGLIERLQRQYPQIDVLAIAGNIGDSARNPNAVLVAACREAASAPPRPEASSSDASAYGSTSPTTPPHGGSQEKAAEHAGYWNPEGNWVHTGDLADYEQAPSGSITRSVRQLVFLRRERNLTPRQAALLVEAHGLRRAFPNRAQWLDQQPVADVEQWHGCMASTSAEQAVKTAGLGRYHHAIRWSDNDPIPASLAPDSALVVSPLDALSWKQP